MELQRDSATPHVNILNESGHSNAEEWLDMQSNCNWQMIDWLHPVIRGALRAKELI